MQNGIGIKQAEGGQDRFKLLPIARIAVLVKSRGVGELEIPMKQTANIKRLIAQELKTLYFPIIKRNTKKPRGFGN